MIKKLLEQHIGYLFILPGMLVLVFIAIWPLIFSLRISFTDYSLLNPPGEFVGIQNYVDQLSSHHFWEVVRTTLVYAASSILISFLLGFFMALLVYNVEEKSVFQLLFILPTLLSSALIGRIWKAMYNPIFGWVNSFAGFIGIPRQAWLGDPQLSLFSVIVVDIWQWTPFAFLILLSGLMGIPKDYIYMAKIDGASSWQTLKYVMIPLMSPVMLLVLLFRTVDSFRAFGVIHTLTKGGPGLTTETLSIWAYRWGVMRLMLGKAASISYLLLIIVLIITTSMIRKLYKSL